MKWTSLLIASIMLLSFCANAQPNAYFADNPGGAPTPTTPTSPDALGLQAPTPTAAVQAPSPQERSQGLMKADQKSAYAAAPQGLRATATSPTYNQVIAPPGGYAPNSLYVSYAPQTVAGCNLYANLPLWMNTAGSGSIWFYEWYPSGYLDIQYAGYAYYPGWFKRWFFADVPGWHVLQYYCSGWSNYVYIYVYSSGNYNYWVSPGSSYGPTPLPYVPTQPGSPIKPFPATGHTYYNFKYKSSYGS
jgi:hypothetical protein